MRDKSVFCFAKRGKVGLFGIIKYDTLAPFVPDYTDISKEEALLLLSEPSKIEWCSGRGRINKDDEIDLNADILQQLVEAAELERIVKNKDLEEISYFATRELEKSKRT